MLENDEQKLVVTKMQSREEMVTTVKKYFPTFTVKEIMKPMEYVQFFLICQEVYNAKEYDCKEYSCGIKLHGHNMTV